MTEQHKDSELPNGPMLFVPSPDPHRQAFSPDLYALLWEVENNHFWFQHRNMLIASAFENYFHDAIDFLEIGCGNGIVLCHLEQRFPEVLFVGADVFVEGLYFARRRIRRSQLVQADFMRSPFRHEFDVVGIFDVLEHIDNDVLAIGHLFDSVRPGGGALVTVPQHPFLWSDSDQRAYHRRRYTRVELSEKLVRSGFKILEMVSFISLLLPLVIFSRFLKKVGVGKTKLDEFRIPSSLNRFLGSICSLERLLLTSGLSIPWGSSLLAVVQKPVSCGSPLP